MKSGRDRRVTQRKIRDRSIALVLTGVVALMPPIAGVALVDARLVGLPIAPIYIFAVWALLIVGAAALAGPLRDSGRRSSSPDPASSDLGETR